MEKAVILLSGGMDSAVVLAMAVNMGFVPAALHLNYKQRTESAELRAYLQLCDHYAVKDRLVVDVSFLSQIGGSSLTDFSMNVNEADLDNTEIPNTYVPFRNANILAIATSWAEVLGAKALFIGANQVDSSGYPDTRREFFEAFEKTIYFGTKPDSNIKIHTPILEMTKAQIVAEGEKLKVPFEYTWSCYKENEIACGVCDSCALRLRGFEEAKIKDPIPYSV